MTLKGRLARFYAVALALVLIAFAAAVWAIDAAEEAAEPPEVRALEPPDQFNQRLLIALGTALPIAIAIAMIGARVVSRRGLQPLDDVVAIAGRVSTESLDARVPERADAADEIRPLTAALNGMLARLERSVAGMRRFTADASHELRTPLAALKAELELALTRPRSPDELRATVERSLEQLDRLSRLVEGLLQLARSDAGALPIAPKPIDLVALARAAVEPYEAVLASRHIALTLEAPAPVAALADPLWTGRAIANLVDNACRLTPDGGTLRITLRGHANRAQLEIADSGPGIPAADRERIFERFHRGADARATTDGAGLGLPLAREIARAQSGDLRALDSDRGARFLLELPGDRLPLGTS
jgi:two-component system OmpR family sensor kinase